MTATRELIERLKDVAEWKQIIEKHRRRQNPRCAHTGEGGIDESTIP